MGSQSEANININHIDKEIDDRITLKLSDSFKQKDESGNFEWTATMININMVLYLME